MAAFAATTPQPGNRRSFFPIPALSARALGAFRIALGIGLTVYAATRSIPSGTTAPRHYGTPDLEFIHAVAASPPALEWIYWSTVVAAFCFAVGLLARASFAVFVALRLVSTLVILETSGAHDLGLPLITMIGWLTVRWGDGLSLDQLLRQRFSSRPVPAGLSRAYGFAIWWPGLTLGLGLLSAAYTKMARTSWEWVSTGAVRYHFVMDYWSAHVDWGLWIASHPTVAVPVSGAAVLLEAVFVLVIFVQRNSLRFLACIGGAALFLGVYLLQGVYWPLWHLLLLAFLPWSLLDRQLAPAGATARLAKSQWMAIAAFTVVQLSAMLVVQREFEPFISHFPMYSNTYASPEDFERQTLWRWIRIDEAFGDNADMTPLINELTVEDRATLVLLADERATPPNSSETTRLCRSLANAAPELPASVSLKVRRAGFDWDAGRFYDYRPLPVGDVPLREICAGTAS